MVINYTVADNTAKTVHKRYNLPMWRFKELMTEIEARTCDYLVEVFLKAKESGEVAVNTAVLVERCLDVPQNEREDIIFIPRLSEFVNMALQKNMFKVAEEILDRGDYQKFEKSNGGTKVKIRETTRDNPEVDVEIIDLEALLEKGKASRKSIKKSKGGGGLKDMLLMMALMKAMKDSEGDDQ